MILIQIRRLSIIKENVTFRFFLKVNKINLFSSWKDLDFSGSYTIYY